MTSPDPMRYPEKFEDDGGSISYSFDGNVIEWQPGQKLRKAISPIAGADYAYDFAGLSPWAKEPSIEVVRLEIQGANAAAVMSELDTLQKKLMQIGRGRLYTLLGASTRRWAKARLMEMPSWEITADDYQFLQIICRFIRLDDWRSSSATTGTESSINSVPHDFTITNPGNQYVYDPVFRLRSNAAGGFTNPTLTNLTNGYSVGTTRDAVDANSEIKIDCGQNAIKWSTDNGASYANDYGNRVLGATQHGLMRLDPGANSMRYTDGGTPNLDLEYSFYGAWH